MRSPRLVSWHPHHDEVVPMFVDNTRNTHALPTGSATSAVLSALVAADRSGEALAAIRVAAALEALGRIRPRAINVNETFAFDATNSAVSAVYEANAMLADDAHNERLQSLRAHMAEAAAAARTWPLRLAVGDAVHAIADQVAHGDVDLVIAGLRRHARVDRVMGNETTLNLIRVVDVPVLGTACWLHHAPTRIVVGVDFGRAGARTAAFACRILADGGTLTLAYVEAMPWPSDQPEDSEGFSVVHAEGIRGAFARIRASLPLPPGARVETEVLTGVPAAALLDYADRTSADLIAVGRQHHRAVNRLLLGSVTTAVVRDGRCSVLVMPRDSQ